MELVSGVVNRHYVCQQNVFGPLVFKNILDHFQVKIYFVLPSPETRTLNAGKRRLQKEEYSKAVLTHLL